MCTGSLRVGGTGESLYEGGERHRGDGLEAERCWQPSTTPSRRSGWLARVLTGLAGFDLRDCALERHAHTLLPAHSRLPTSPSSRLARHTRHAQWRAHCQTAQHRTNRQWKRGGPASGRRATLSRALRPTRSSPCSPSRTRARTSTPLQRHYAPRISTRAGATDSCGGTPCT